MKTLLRHTLQLVLFASLTFVAACGSPTPEDRETLVQRSQVALEDLSRRVPASKAIADTSRAILVFPSVTEAAVGIGGGYGRGILFEHGRAVGIYSAGGASLGFQLGAQTHSEAYFFTTDQAYSDFRRSGGFEFGGGVSFAVADVGASGQISSVTLQKPIIVFVWGQQGLMAGINIAGRVVTRIGD